MSSSFSREFDIWQMTPIIHFQSDEYQAGATLRATEVKPKLDRFLCEQYKANPGGEIPAAWILDAPGDDLHLNYKMQIIPKGEEKLLVASAFPMYFGNMGNDTKKKDGVFCEEGLILKIICLISDKTERDNLMNFLAEQLELFFLTHNFGTRQDKGYGGFLYQPGARTLDQLRNQLNHQLERLQRKYPGFIYFRLNQPVRPELQRGYPRQNNRMQNGVQMNNNTEWARKVDLVCMAMKTGRNETMRTRPGGNREHNYVKGFLMFYGVEGNDKAMMKGTYGVGLTKEKTKPKVEKLNPNQYRFKRAVLGLSERYEFRRAQDIEGRTVYGATIGVEHVPDQNEDKIDRFPSPVLVKVLPDAVCFLPESAEPILGKKFRFTKQEQNGRPGRGNASFNLSTPESFDTKLFLSDFGVWYNREFFNKRSQYGERTLRARCAEIKIEFMATNGGRRT